MMATVDSFCDLFVARSLGIITDVNQQTEALTGHTRVELIGSPFKNYFTDSLVQKRASGLFDMAIATKKLR